MARPGLDLSFREATVTEVKFVGVNINEFMILNEIKLLYRNIIGLKDVVFKINRRSS